MARGGASLSWWSLWCKAVIVAISLKIKDILSLRLSTVSSAMMIAEVISMTVIRELSSSGGAIGCLPESVLLSRLEGTGLSLSLLLPGLLNWRWLILVELFCVLLIPKRTLTSHTRIVGAADRRGDIVTRTESAVEEARGTSAEEAGRARVGIHNHCRTAKLRSVKLISTVTVLPATEEECNEEADNCDSDETTGDTADHGTRVKRA